MNITKIYLILALTLCACAADEKKSETASEDTNNKDKRQTEGETVPGHVIYRTARKQEQVAPVQEPQDDDDDKPLGRVDLEEYRPGQVISLNAQELLELQPERKAPSGSSGQQLQQLYEIHDVQPEHKQNLQQFYYLEPQVAKQVALQPSRAVIARPHYSSNGGEASVGAALAVSDTGSSNRGLPFDQDLLSLLSQTPVRQEEQRLQYAQLAQVQQPSSISVSQEEQRLQYAQPAQVQQASTVGVRQEEQRLQYTQPAQVPQHSTVSVAPQYKQVDRYITKPSKKSTKMRSKVHITPPQHSAAPQQYLIETTNVQHQQQQQQAQQFLPQYRPAPQLQRTAQALRYVQVPSVATQQYYENAEPEGLKVVAAPNLQNQQSRQQPYRLVSQYHQEATPKQFRVLETTRFPIRQEQVRQLPNIDRPVSYLKRFPEPETIRAVKLYDQLTPEQLQQQQQQQLQHHQLQQQQQQNLQQQQQQDQQQQQIINDQYYLRSLYRANDQRPRYDIPQYSNSGIEQARLSEPTKTPLSTIYVNKNLAPKKVVRPQPYLRDQSVRVEQQIRLEEPRLEQVNVKQYSQHVDDRPHALPPPRNNKAYTPEEFAALVAAGYAVTPVPVSTVGQVAQSRSSIEEHSMQIQHRRPLYTKRHQYLPLRSDEAP